MDARSVWGGGSMPACRMASTPAEALCVTPAHPRQRHPREVQRHPADRRGTPRRWDQDLRQDDGNSGPADPSRWHRAAHPPKWRAECPGDDLGDDAGSQGRGASRGVRVHGGGSRSPVGRREQDPATDRHRDHQRQAGPHRRTGSRARADRPSVPCAYGRHAANGGSTGGTVFGAASESFRRSRASHRPGCGYRCDRLTPIPGAGRERGPGSCSGGPIGHPSSGGPSGPPRVHTRSRSSLGAWTLVNLFAANDPHSTLLALSAVETRFRDIRRPIALFASRADRAARDFEFAATLAGEHQRFSQVVIWGERTRAMVRKVRCGGLGEDQVVDAGSMDPGALTRLLMERMDGNRVVVGMGNILGPASRLLQHLEGVSS
jgi:hypothetical protein